MPVCLCGLREVPVPEKEHVMVAVHSPGPKTAMTCLQCMSGFRRLTMRIFLSVVCVHDRRMTVSSHLPV